MPAEGNAIVYCEGAFNTTNGKTAHGLVRFTLRYQILSVIDSRYAGHDAGAVLDGRANRIPLLSSVEEAFARARDFGLAPSHLVIGLAPDGGRLSRGAREDIKKAIALGLNIDSGLHDFVSEDPELRALAVKMNVTIRDVRKPKHRESLHFFTGKIDEVEALKVAVLGTDSAVGKRTTAWLIVNALKEKGVRAELVGTGQTAWMQGATFGIIMDSLINDFVSGEIEHAVWSAWKEMQAEVIVVEGQGSLLNPAYPGGHEILASARPDLIVLQHAPSRKVYDGFPGYPLDPLPRQIAAIQIVSGKPVIAITLNHEDIRPEEIALNCKIIGDTMGIPTFDVLAEGPRGLVNIIENHLMGKNKKTAGV